MDVTFAAHELGLIDGHPPFGRLTDLVLLRLLGHR
jgi:hypothetical protein